MPSHQRHCVQRSLRAIGPFGRCSVLSLTDTLGVGKRLAHISLDQERYL